MSDALHLAIDELKACTECPRPEARTIAKLAKQIFELFPTADDSYITHARARLGKRRSRINALRYTSSSSDDRALLVEASIFLCEASLARPNATPDRRFFDLYDLVEALLKNPSKTVTHSFEDACQQAIAAMNDVLNSIETYPETQYKKALKQRAHDLVQIVSHGVAPNYNYPSRIVFGQLKACIESPVPNAERAVELAQNIYDLSKTTAGTECRDETTTLVTCLQRLRALRKVRPQQPTLGQLVKTTALLCEASLLKTGRDSGKEFLDLYELYEALRWDPTQGIINNLENVIQRAAHVGDCVLEEIDTGDLTDKNYCGYLRGRVANIYGAMHQHLDLSAVEKKRVLEKALVVWDRQIAAHGGDLPRQQLDFAAPRISYCYKYLGNYEAAIQWLLKVYEPDKSIRLSTSWEARVRIAEYYTRMGVAAIMDGHEVLANSHWALAIKHYEDAHRLDDPTSALIESKKPALLKWVATHYLYAREYEQSEKYFIAHFSQSLASSRNDNPDDDRVRLYLGFVYMRSGNTAEAINMFSLLLQRTASISIRKASFAALIDLHSSTGNQSAIDALFSDTSLLFGGFPPQNGKAEIQKHYAITIAADFVAMNNFTQQCNNLLDRNCPLEVLKRLNELFDEAREFDNVHIENDKVLLSIAGKAHFRLGNSEQAISYFEKTFNADSRSKNRSMALRWIGDVLASRGQYEAALDKYRQAIELQKHPSTVVASAISSAEIGDINGAIDRMQMLRASTLDRRPVFTDTLTAKLLWKRFMLHGAPSDVQFAVDLTRKALAAEIAERGTISARTIYALAPILNSDYDDGLLVSYIDQFDGPTAIRALCEIFAASSSFKFALFDAIGLSIKNRIRDLPYRQELLKLFAQGLVGLYYRDNGLFEYVGFTFAESLKTLSYSEYRAALREVAFGFPRACTHEVLVTYADEASQLFKPILEANAETAWSILSDSSSIEKIGAFLDKDPGAQPPPSAFQRLDKNNVFELLTFFITTRVEPLQYLRLGIVYGPRFTINPPPEKIFISGLDWLNLSKSLEDALDIAGGPLSSWVRNEPVEVELHIIFNEIRVILRRYARSDNQSDEHLFHSVQNNCYTAIQESRDTLRLSFYFKPPPVESIPQLVPFVKLLAAEEQRLLQDNGAFRDNFYSEAMAAWADGPSLLDTPASDIVEFFRQLIDTLHSEAIKWLSVTDRTSGSIPHPRSLIHDLLKPTFRQFLSNTSAESDQRAAALEKALGEINNFALTLRRSAQHGLGGITARPISLYGMLTELAERFSGVVQIQISCPPDCHVSTDRFFFQRALINLIDNARTAAENSANPILKCVATMSEEETDIVRIEVINSYDPEAPEKTGGSGHGILNAQQALERFCGGSLNIERSPDMAIFIASIQVPRAHT